MTKTNKPKLAITNKRNAKKRMGNKLRPNLSGKARTPGQIINTLARNINSKLHPKKMDPYIMCRLNPFSGGNGKGIPDGTNHHFIVLDSYQYDNIDFSSFTADQFPSTFILQTTNSLPNLMWANCPNNKFMKINGVTFKGTGVYNGTAEGISAWYPMATLPAMTNTYGNFSSSQDDPWGATGLRIISQGFRIIYTGPVTECSGSITVTPNNWTYSPGPTITGITAVATTVNLRAVNVDQTASTNFAPVGLGTYQIDGTNSTTLLSKDSVTVRPEQGITIIPRHVGTSRDMIPIMKGSRPVTFGNTAQGAGAILYNACANSGTAISSVNGGICFFDNDWDNYQIVFQNVNNTASFRIESVICFEACVGATSAFAPLTHKVSENKPAVMKEAAKQENMVPPVKPNV